RAPHLLRARRGRRRSREGAAASLPRLGGGGSVSFMSRNGISNGTAAILDKALSGERIGDDEAMALLESRDLVSVGRAADELRHRKVDRARVTVLLEQKCDDT